MKFLAINALNFQVQVDVNVDVPTCAVEILILLISHEITFCAHEEVDEFLQ